MKLLSMVRKQFLLLKAAGLATPDLCEEYSSTASLIEEGREISWADQSTGSKENLKFAALLNTNTNSTFTGMKGDLCIYTKSFFGMRHYVNQFNSSHFYSAVSLK